jgi:hypothetical protein
MDGTEQQGRRYGGLPCFYFQIALYGGNQYFVKIKFAL